MTKQQANIFEQEDNKIQEISEDSKNLKSETSYATKQCDVCLKYFVYGQWGDNYYLIEPHDKKSVFAIIGKSTKGNAYITVNDTVDDKTVKKTHSSHRAFCIPKRKT